MYMYQLYTAISWDANSCKLLFRGGLIWFVKRNIKGRISICNEGADTCLSCSKYLPVYIGC